MYLFIDSDTLFKNESFDYFSELKSNKCYTNYNCKNVSEYNQKLKLEKIEFVRKQLFLLDGDPTKSYNTPD